MLSNEYCHKHIQGSHRFRQKEIYGNHESSQGMVKKILVAIDGSDPAQKALDYALDLAERCGAEVVILSVIPLFVYSLNSTKALIENEALFKI